jgi:DNA-binding NarL/FixJ family response regulator
MENIKVLIADDQKLFAQSLKIVLENYTPLFETIRIANDGIEMLSIMEKEEFDLIIMDISMPNMDGIKAAQEIRKMGLQTKILMLSSFGYDSYVRASFNLGANGYILKDSSPEELIKAINDIFDEKRVLSREIADYLNGKLPKTESKFKYPEIFKELTSQERRVLSLISKGFSNDEIAEKLFLSGHTIRNYISSINDKLGTKDRFEALRMAIEYNIDLLL